MTDRVRRRVMLSAAAWAVPTAVVAGAAPAFAKSCEDTVISFGQFGPIVDISGKHASDGGYNGGRDGVTSLSWESREDQLTERTAALGLTSLEYSITYQLPVTAGTPVTLSTSVQTGRSDHSSTTSLEQRMSVTAGDELLGRYSTRTQAYAPDQYYTDNSQAQGNYGASGLPDRGDGYRVLVGEGTTPLSWTFTPTTSGTIPLTFTFWRATNTTGQSFLSLLTPFDATRPNTRRVGNDKLLVAPITRAC